MPSRRHVASIVFALVVVAGCASTKVTNRQVLVNGKLPRPERILVYDFSASPADIPADSALTGQYAEPATPATAEQIEIGRQLGAQVAQELVADIRGMGLPAMQATARVVPQIGDIVIKGYFVSIEEGSAAKRVVLGFGSGNAELKTMVEGYQVTAQGLRKLGSGTVDSGGGKTPGAALPAAVMIATANPIGLIVSGGMKIYGEASGKSTIEGKAKATAKEIANTLKPRFEQQGWI